jgi:hypothetical protein
MSALLSWYLRIVRAELAVHLRPLNASDPALHINIFCEIPFCKATVVFLKDRV